MLLAVDIGNTNISCGLFQSSRLVRRFDLSTRQYSAGLLRKKLGKAQIKDACICSVVPAAGARLGKDCAKLFGFRPQYIGKGKAVPLKNRYRTPRTLGQDRLVNAYAAAILYGAPVAVIDAGTAITIDLVSQKKEYLGGMIMPGMQMSLDALSQRTALLPRLSLRRPKRFIGQDTESSMLSGVVWGEVSRLTNLIVKIKKEIGERAKVIATGGNARLLRKCGAGFDAVDENLTLTGLRLIYNFYAKKTL